MSPLSYLVIFCALAVGSLVVVSIVNERENRQRILKQKLRQMRFQVQDMEELVLEVNQLTEKPMIAKLLNDEILERVLAMKEANPDAGHLQASHQTALARLQEFENPSTLSDRPPIDRLRNSDAQIARSQRALEEAGIIIKRQQNRGKITLEDMNLLLLELNWAHLMIGVISHVGQGHKAIRRRDLLSAHAFYKKAQQLLIQSSHPDTRRHEFIKEVSEMLNNNRSAISPRLMPETHLNPGEESNQSAFINASFPDQEDTEESLSFDKQNALRA
ncbi:hypothetical protein [Pseudomaricurvus sp.]|uniref:hypothetical protein n=1 Tax=Pseudomaricurvus sp. TaxID=2004510 RepID=UPI003F6BC55F